MSHASWDADLASEIIARHAARPGALLPMLQALHEVFGCIAEDAIPIIAAALNLGRAEVHGVVSFYHDFRSSPAGRHVLKLCRAEACQASGGDALAEQVLQQLGLAWGDTTRDGMLTIESVFCLGLCASGPAALLDERPLGRLSTHKLAKVLETCSA